MDKSTDRLTPPTFCFPTLPIPGSYKMSTFTVRVLSDSVAIIKCEQHMGSAFIKRVSVGWLERRRGVNLEEKITKKAMELKEMMQAHNAELKRKRDMERRIENLVMHE
ncbi:hypothetical protein [Paenibacillus alvei]|uniref:hypothetical protein n=1 Tax=Paenibacillus alvei TaxID=44250 RepID=UPI00227FB119|nr:hypothetical protein [Paenibacillus alvei]MCY7485802.1 hypothetical protein [Paenibacillus alvei]